SLRRAVDGSAVALQAVDLGLRLGLDVVRQRRVLQLRRDLLAGAEAVVQPVLDELGLRRILAGLARVRPHEQERDGADRVRLRVGRVDRAEAQVLRGRDARGGGGRGLQRRLDVLAGLVLDRGGRELVLQCVRLLDVADRALRLLHAAGDAVVALGAGAGRPLDRLVRAGAALPGRGVVGEEGGEVRRRAGLVGAVADRDARGRQLRARVLARDLRVVPLLDLAEEDVGDRLAVELEALVDAVDVVGDGYGTEHRRDVDRVAALLLGGRDLVVLHRGVGGAEVDSARAELRDAAAGADGLVVDRRALLLLEAGGPLLVDGRRERRAGAVDGAAGLGGAAAGRAGARAAGAGAAVVAAAGRRAQREHGAAAQSEQVLVPHGGLLVVRFVGRAGGRLADRGEPVTALAPGCEKRVKVLARIGSRIRRACGCSARPEAPAPASRAACGCRRRSTGRPRAALLPRRAGRGPPGGRSHRRCARAPRGARTRGPRGSVRCPRPARAPGPDGSRARRR